MGFRYAHIMKRWMVGLMAAVVVLLVGVTVLLVVVINQNNQAAEQAEWDRKVQICNDTYGPIVDTGDSLDANIACLEQLSRD
ncbi:hypothetical protein SAMN04488590_3379 [Microbacterium sp. 77mftsu3.1]|nr:hypothetical protein SAMN04488590_3379 [Microbacterium sp. 77mftsu3.1]